MSVLEHKYYWCLKHDRVEDEEHACRAADRLGPYDTPEQAEHALELVEERNKKWEAEDREWENG